MIKILSKLIQLFKTKYGAKYNAKIARYKRIALKRCPNCGKRTELKVIKHFFVKNKYVVVCQNKKCHSVFSWTSRQQFIRYEYFSKPDVAIDYFNTFKGVNRQ